MFYEVTRRMLKLYCCDVIDKQVSKDLEFIDSLITNVNIQSQIAPRILQLGLIELCQHLCRKKLFWCKPFDDTGGQWPVGVSAAYASLSCVVNLTDISKDACHRVIDICLYEDIFRFLNLDSMDPSKVKFCPSRCSFADTAMSVVYNAIQASWLFNIFFVVISRDAPDPKF